MHPSTPPRPDLDGIEARANAATPGPWEAGPTVSEDEHPNQTFSIQTSIYPPTGECGPVAMVAGHEDPPFITAARQDVPALVAYARSLEAEVAALREQVEDYRHAAMERSERS